MSKKDDVGGEVPLRLCELSKKDVNDLKKARQRHGDKRYGDEHMHKYNLLDVLEELLDARNILDLYSKRIGLQDISKGKRFWEHFKELNRLLLEAEDELRALDLFVTDFERREDVERVGVDSSEVGKAGDSGDNDFVNDDDSNSVDDDFSDDGCACRCWGDYVVTDSGDYYELYIDDSGSSTGLSSSKDVNNSDGSNGSNNFDGLQGLFDSAINDRVDERLDELRDMIHDRVYVKYDSMNPQSSAVYRGALFDVLEMINELKESDDVNRENILEIDLNEGDNPEESKCPFCGTKFNYVTWYRRKDKGFVDGSSFEVFFECPNDSCPGVILIKR